MHSNKGYILAILVAFLIGGFINGMAQDRTVGMVFRDSTKLDDGYYLFSPKSNTKTYLVNSCGELVNSWNSTYEPGNTEALDANGDIFIAKNIGTGENPTMAAGGQGGIMEKYSWEGQLLWSYQISDSNQLAHHDFQILPNGNLLILAFDHRNFNECIQAGRDSSKLPNQAVWSEKIIEIRPILPDGAEVVWEWYLWDHLVQDYDATKDNFDDVSQHPELMDVNFTRNSVADWLHSNAMDYNPENDQIILSARNFNEFYIIDHSTTTEEAASHSGGRWGKGGDFLFRYGNPMSYRAGDSSDMVFFDQHNVNWIDAGLPDEGNIMVFNNGRNRPDELFSQVLKLFPAYNDVDTSYVFESGVYQLDTTHIIFEGVPRDSFYAALLSGASQLTNNHYLISHGPGGTFFEIDEFQNVIMKYIIPVDGQGNIYSQGDTNIIGGGPILGSFFFRAHKYSPDFIGFTNKDLSSIGFIEREPLPSLCPGIPSAIQSHINDALLIKMYPMPIGSERTLYLELDHGIQLNNYSISSLDGRLIESEAFHSTSSTYTIPLSPSIRAGMYLLTVSGMENGKTVVQSTMVVIF